MIWTVTYIELEEHQFSCVNTYNLYFVVQNDSVICSCVSDGFAWSTESYDYELLRHGKDRFSSMLTILRSSHLG